MTRGALRRLHTGLIAALVLEIQRRGLEVALDEGYVGHSAGPGCPHRRDGGHFKGIAVDVLLYRCQHVPAHLAPCPDPTYLTDAAAYAPFNTWWEAQHPLCHTIDHDRNHFAILDGGVL